MLKINPKIIGETVKNVQKASTSVRQWDYMINGNENEAENEKQIT